MKLTLDNLSNHATLSLSDEKHIQTLLGCRQDDDILQEMIDFLIGVPEDWQYGGCEFCD